MFQDFLLIHYRISPTVIATSDLKIKYKYKTLIFVYALYHIFKSFSVTFYFHVNFVNLFLIISKTKSSK